MTPLENPIEQHDEIIRVRSTSNTNVSFCFSDPRELRHPRLFKLSNQRTELPRF